MRLLLLIILFTYSLQAEIFKDRYDRDVNILNNKKIVCLGPGALRLLVYLNLQDNLVGIEKSELRLSKHAPYTMALDKKFIKDLPIVSQGGPGKMPNLESLIELKPDIIFTSLLSKEQVDLIQEKTKTPVIALSYGSTYGGNRKGEKKLDAIKSSLKLIAQVMNKEERYKKLLKFMQNQEKELEKYSINDTSIYIGGVAYKGLQGITSTESAYTPFELLKIKNNILKEHIGHAFINNETLLEFNPEIIFLDFVSKKIIQEEIKRDRVIFDNIKAFQNKRVYWLYPNNFYNTNIENIYLNSWQILSYFHKNIDVKRKRIEIYRAFLGQNIDNKIDDLVDINVQ